RAIKTTASLGLRSGIATRTAATRVAAAESTPEKPGFFKSVFEKLFGKPAPTTLAYAATDDAGLSGTNTSIGGRYDRFTAVYDISAHTVYMPDGTRLEAHSGLANRLDDPRYADERMHGVTPPNIYDLELREAPFHGVRALRMIPEDESKTFGAVVSSPTPTCSGPTAIRTAACRLKITMRSCRPISTKKLSGWPSLRAWIEVLLPPPGLAANRKANGLALT